MSVGVNITIKDTASPAIEQLLATTKPARVEAAVGPAVNRLTQQHLAKQGTNKRGWPTTHFFARAARATSWQGSGSGSVTVSINQIGVRQRYHGGRIAPVNARALTIPISPVSYGKTASDFPGLFLLKTKKGAYLVQPGEAISEKGNIVKGRKLGGNSKRRQRAGLNFLFKLSPGVNQVGDPSIIPADKEYLNTATQQIEKLLGGVA